MTDAKSNPIGIPSTDQTLGAPPAGSYSPPAFTLSTSQGMTADTDVAPGSSPDANAMATAAARDRRDSAEWDASKVPPSRFQKRKGSIYSTPSSRDGHVASNYAAKFHAKHAELGYNK